MAWCIPEIRMEGRRKGGGRGGREEGEGEGRERGRGGRKGEGEGRERGKGGREEGEGERGRENITATHKCVCSTIHMAYTFWEFLQSNGYPRGDDNICVTFDIQKSINLKLLIHSSIQ